MAGRDLHGKQADSPCDPPPARDALIVANGSLLAGDMRMLEQRRTSGGESGPGMARSPLIVATDGAAARLVRQGIVPDLVVGDFDSLAPAVRAQLPPESLVHVPDQNSCDLEKAIVAAIDHGCRRITVVGALGRRWDHSLTTISLLIRYSNEAHIEVRHGWTRIRTVTHRITITGAAGDRISLVNFGPARGVTLTGVAWPLDGATIGPGSLGVSNRMAAASAELSLDDGCLIVCHQSKAPRGRPAR